ncbi:hypothetical protein HK096_007329 [Nowakowskiella sp. JEL0078]|nr:hypothetical protein HK096_007329 [Nowakowskiella sp. JEL0078]
MIKEILETTWLSCVQPDDESGEEFVADAIISNPVSFGHIHCAQLLHIPLHIFFTMPWSPTHAFPHPLTTISAPKVAAGTANYFSYDAVDLMTWSGLGDLINDFRKDIGKKEGVKMDELIQTNGPFLLKDLKPTDWGDHIECTGFIFLDLAKQTNFTPDPELQKFLESGPPPVYIGFGSIVVDDPDEMTNKIFQAVTKSGIRALVSKGWGGLGGNDLKVPESIHLIGNVPHDWLFQKVSAVCHHGGAGTTAAGLRAGLPTIIVPFFGDQYFWGWELWKAGVSPVPLPYKTKFTVENLSEAFLAVQSAPMIAAAREIGAKLVEENGAKLAVDSFYRQLPLKYMLCDVDPTKLASFYSVKYDIKLSEAVARTLAEKELIVVGDLKPYRSVTWNTEIAHSKSILGMSISAIDKPLNEVKKGISGLFTEPISAFKKAGSASTTLEMAETVAGGVGKGVLGAVLIPVKAGNKFVGGVADAMRSTSAAINNETPEGHRIVTDVSSGFTEGFKSLAKNVRSAGTGLVEKTYSGAVNEGVFGVVKGVVIGTTDAGIKTVTGAIDLVNLSRKGIAKSAKHSIQNFRNNGKSGEIEQTENILSKNANDETEEWKNSVEIKFREIAEWKVSHASD